MEGIEKLVIQRVKAAGVLRPRDLDEDGVPREYLGRLRKRAVGVKVVVA